MEPKEFAKGTRPREIFVYTCQRIAGPFLHLGYRYRKSKNDIYKKDDMFAYFIYFRPSIQFGSTTFSVHIAVESEKLANWRRDAYRGQEENGVAVLSTLAGLTKRDQVWPKYEVSTFLERERSIAEITQQIAEFALPFFARFADVGPLVEEVAEHGFLPHRKKRRGPDDRQMDTDFVKCFGNGHP